MSDSPDVMRAEVERVHCVAAWVAVVRLAGVLTVDTAPAARTALLKAVAAEPDVVVADLALLTVPDDVVLTMFPAVARHAAAWPGIPLVLADPGRALAAALDRTAVPSSVPVVGSVSAACRTVDRVPVRRLVERMEAGPRAITIARRVVREGCERWGVPAPADVAELIMAELVSNAVRYAAGPIEVTVSLRRRYLHLAVRDRSAATPRPGRDGGRGLLLVDALATAWGHTAVEDGKVVWATLPTL